MAEDEVCGDPKAPALSAHRACQIQGPSKIGAARCQGPSAIPRHQRPYHTGPDAATPHARVPSHLARRTKDAAEAGLGAGIAGCGLVVQGEAAQ